MLQHDLLKMVVVDVRQWHYPGYSVTADVEPREKNSR